MATVTAKTVAAAMAMAMATAMTTAAVATMVVKTETTIVVMVGVHTQQSTKSSSGRKGAGPEGGRDRHRRAGAVCTRACCWGGAGQ